MSAVAEMRMLVESLPGSGRDHRFASQPDSPIDWTRLTTLASWHGMTPLLAAKLFQAPPHPEPGDPAIVDALQLLRSRQSTYLGWTFTNLSALVELQRELDRKGLRVVAWKGPSAALLLYGSASLREWGDLDFLFLEEDLAPVLEIAKSLGYELQESREQPDSRDLYLLTQKREFTFLRPCDQVVLEFHLQILPARFSLWQDSRAHVDRAEMLQPVGDAHLRIEQPGDLLVSLCAHATKHHWDRLKWSADIAQFVEKYRAELDWHSLLGTLAPKRKHLVVLLGLALACELYGTELPATAEAWLLRSPELPRLAGRVAAHLMTGSQDPAPEADRKAMAALLCPRWQDRLIYNLTPLVELNYEDLYIPVRHRALFFLNYFFRVVRLLRKYGPQRLATKTAGSVRSVH